MSPRRVALALALPLLALTGGAGAPAGAQDCREVAYLVRAIAAPQANSLVQGTEILVPVAYSLVEQETLPEFVYAEAGSAALGALEGQDGTEPPPGRAVSGYPAESLPPEAEASWGAGSSRTAADQHRGTAASETGPDSGGTSAVESQLDCDRVVVEATWSVRGLTVGAGSVGEVTQRVRVELGPDGAPDVDVETVVVDAALPLGGLPGQVPIDVARDFFAAGGQTFDVQDPQVTTGDGSAHVRSHPIVFGFGQPDGSQGIETRMGYLEITAERLGALPPLPASGAAAGVAAGAAPASPAALLPALPGDGVGALPDAVASLTSDALTGPEMVAVSSPGEVVDHVARSAADWWPPVLLVALGAMCWWRVAERRRDVWPTADWTLTQLERAGHRFRTTYLEW